MPVLQLYLLGFVLCMYFQCITSNSLPLIINTWPFVNATEKAWQAISSGGSAHDAVVSGCSECEQSTCGGSVGFGGSPDENGDTTLDAMIMDGQTYDAGCVGDLKNVRNAIGVAMAVMKYTDHTLLVGDSAVQFAVEMGFTKQSTQTNKSETLWEAWKEANCQPNYRRNVFPDPSKSCGPYKPADNVQGRKKKPRIQLDQTNHDTIGIVVIDKAGNVVSGTSTNGLNHKVPGRVGDSPIVGAGSYASYTAGGAAATGDGDVMMRFLPSFKAVTLMEQGLSPSEAAALAIKPIIMAYPTFSGAIIAANIKGVFGAACHNVQGGFHFSVRNPSMLNVTVEFVPCI